MEESINNLIIIEYLSIRNDLIYIAVEDIPYNVEILTKSGMSQDEYLQMKEGRLLDITDFINENWVLDENKVFRKKENNFKKMIFLLWNMRITEKESR